VRYFGADGTEPDTNLAGEFSTTEKGRRFIAPQTAGLPYAGPFRSLRPGGLLSYRRKSPCGLAGMKRFKVLGWPVR